MSINSYNNEGKKEEETIIQNMRTQQMRAFFCSRNVHFKNIIIDGIYPDDNAFNKSKNITIEDTHILLRYCAWYCHNIILNKTIFEENSRSSMWYCKNIELVNCKINSVKACRDCSNLILKDCIINSDEFGWKCQSIKIINCKINGATSFFEVLNVKVDGAEFKADYMFEYSDNIKILNSTINSKDCFWNSKNVYCKNCKISGDYFGWHSESCIFENCHIDSDMPLCYCKRLKLINCTMSTCVLGFEYSEVDADIKGYIDSARNVLSGKIIVDSYGEFVKDENGQECKGVIELRSKEEKQESK